jgi:hypothetical protein
MSKTYLKSDHFNGADQDLIMMKFQVPPPFLANGT